MNSEKIKHYNLSFSISELINQIDNNRIILDKDKYRNLVWDLKKQSLFIDSIFRDFPTQSIFLYEDEDNRITVIDGIQRLRTIYSFYNNELKIICQGSELDRHRYEDLSDHQRNRFNYGRIYVTMIEYMWNSSELITELFYRLNTGGASLTNQEYRNRMFFGAMINSINLLNTDHLWRRMYNKNVNIRYKDSEYILRFFTCIIDDLHSTRPIAESMNNFIEINRNDGGLAEECADIFRESLHIVSNRLGHNALLINGRFSSLLFDSLLIPLGILLKRNTDYNLEHTYERLLNLFQEEKIQYKSTKVKIAIGLDMLVGDGYEL